MQVDGQTITSETRRIAGTFAFVGAGIGSIGVLGKLLLGQFLGSIFILVAVTVTLLSGPILAAIIGLQAPTSERGQLVEVGLAIALGYILGSFVSVLLLTFVGDLPLGQLVGGVLVFAIPTGLVGSGVRYLAEER